MKTKQKIAVALSSALALWLAVAPGARAMHIMEGYLPPAYCIAWGVVALPFLVGSYFHIQKRVREQASHITLLAMAAAFVFVLSSLKIPSVTGSCSHMTGTGLGAILFGGMAMPLLGSISLLFQALLLAHGGITTLGANVFSMAVAGPFLTYGIYALGRRLGWNSKWNIFAAASLGNLFTYCITSLQLALAYPSAQGGIGASVGKFLAVFAPTQLPLAVMEGILTVLMVMALEGHAQEEMGFLARGRKE